MATSYSPSIASESATSRYSGPAVAPKLDQRRSEQYILRHNRLKVVAKSEYREILFVAEKIKLLNDQVTDLDRMLAELARYSDVRRIERVVANVTGLREHERQQRFELTSVQAVLQLLSKCPLVTSGLLNKKTSLLLAAKLLAISRHLISVVRKQQVGADQVYPELRSREASLDEISRRLKVRLDGYLARTSGSTTEIAQVLAAQALVRDQGASQVISRFQDLRIKKLHTIFKQTTSRHQRCEIALHHLLDSLNQIHAFRDGVLSKTWRGISQNAVLVDPLVLQITELNLSALQSQLPPEITGYRLRFSGSVAYDVDAEGFNQRISDAFCRELRTVLKDCTSLPEAFDLRNSLLHARPNHGSRSAYNKSMFQTVMRLFDEWLTQHVTDEARRLDEVLETFETVIADTSSVPAQKDSSIHSPWHPSLAPSSSSLNHEDYMQSIVRTSQGYTDQLSSIVEKLDAYVMRIHATRRSIASTRQHHVDQSDSDSEDDTESETENDGAGSPRPGKRRTSATKGPKLLSAMEDSTTQAIIEMRNRLEGFLTEELEKEPETSKIGILIRSEREISRRLKLLQPQVELNPFKPSEQLLSLLVERTISEPMATLRRGYVRSIRSPVARKLWVGEPAKPSLPSSAMFRFLTDLTNAMSIVGQDLRTGFFRQMLHRAVRRAVEDILELGTAVEKVIKPERGDEEDGVDNLAMLQVEFDRCYLQEAMGSSLSDKHDQTQETSPLPDPDLASRAAAYWKRTHLLFSIVS